MFRLLRLLLLRCGYIVVEAGHQAELVQLLQNARRSADALGGLCASLQRANGDLAGLCVRLRHRNARLRQQLAGIGAVTGFLRGSAERN